MSRLNQSKKCRKYKKKKKKAWEKCKTQVLEYIQLKSQKDRRKRIMGEAIS